MRGSSRLEWNATGAVLLRGTATFEVPEGVPEQRVLTDYGELPAGKPMGYVLLKRGHQCVLPAGTAYRFDSRHPGVILQQTIKGVLSVEKWADICLQ